MMLGHGAHRSSLSRLSSGYAKGQGRFAKILMLSSVAALLAACGGMKNADMTMAVIMEAPAPLPPPRELMPPPPMPEMIQARPGLAARERFQLAINLLQQGDAPHAEAELTAYLAEIPNSAPARNLLAQVQTPIEMLYPADFFTVTLGMSETLSTLAGIYMGDVLSFYGLARYNAIPNPSRVSLNQVIRIPKTPNSEMALAARAQMAMPMDAMAMTPTMPPETPAPSQQQASVTPPSAPPRPAAPVRPADPWVSIRADVAAGRFEDAIRTAEERNVKPDRAQAVLLASAYSSNANAVRMADAMLAEAQALRAGQLYLDPANRPEDAIAPLALALEIDPMNMQAQNLSGVAKTRAADSYYRAGLVAFQRQDLDGAIGAWDKALNIDPNHRNAQLNRAQAVELKQNLQRLTR
jgi:tetratricopeptide (TPR) repeat protein